MSQVLLGRGLDIVEILTWEKAVPEARLDTVFVNLPGFRNKGRALQHLVESRGHMVVLSPNDYLAVQA